VLKILRRPAVEALTGLSKPDIYELIAAGSFPRPVKLSAKRVGWLASEIEGWQRQRVAERDRRAA
jgi:prophage regulatory protein